jgi:integrase
MGLQKGRTKAREADPVKPVDDKTVDATLPHLPPVVADMVRFQRLTGCRPDEVCSLRPGDVDRTAEVWLYTPESHKTEHHGRSRVIAIGPKAQTVLLPYLLRDADTFCFSPKDSERKRKESKRTQRKTKVQPSQQDRSAKNAKRRPGEQYTSSSYGYALIRACERAFPPAAPLNRREGESVSEWKARLTTRQRDELKVWNIRHRWSPNQLRHAAATEIRKRYGIEGAQVALGHAYADVTQVYAERDMTLAAKIMKEVG